MTEEENASIKMEPESADVEDLNYNDEIEPDLASESSAPIGDGDNTDDPVNF